MDIIVNGARGRMGQEVCRLLQETIALSLSMESVPGASEESCEMKEEAGKPDTGETDKASSEQ